MSWLDVYVLALTVACFTLSLDRIRLLYECKQLRRAHYNRAKEAEALADSARTQRDTIKHLRERRAEWERENAGLRQALSERRGSR